MNEALLLNAYRHHQSGNLAEAARLYRDILRADPKHFDALCMLGHLYFQRGEKDEASRAADAALLCEPRLPNAHYNLGCLLQGLERHRDAIEKIGRAHV